jgi:two-component system LytT family response regulator
MNRIRTLLVDDEAIALRGMLAMLRTEADIEIVGACQDGAQAVADIARLKPDLVFLDIQMPGMGGFDVIERVGAAAMPPVIFVTAYDKHAVCAFDVQALDYVLKPVDPQRLQQALARYRQLHPPGPERLAIRHSGRVVLADPDDITHITSAGNYIDVFRAGQAMLVRETLAAMEARLDPARFVRISRSTLVNIRHIAEIRPTSNGDFVAVLQDQTVLNGSRRYRTALRHI